MHTKIKPFTNGFASALLVLSIAMTSSATATEPSWNLLVKQQVPSGDAIKTVNVTGVATGLTCLKIIVDKDLGLEWFSPIDGQNRKGPERHIKTFLKPGVEYAVYWSNIERPFLTLELKLNKVANSSGANVLLEIYGTKLSRDECSALKRSAIQVIP
jgi:hypothetical protein